MTEDLPKVSNDLVALLDGNFESLAAGRPKRTSKPSAHLREMIDHGNKLPHGLRQYNMTSETKGPSLEDPSSESKSPNAGNGALAHGYAMSAAIFESRGIDIPQTREQALKSPQSEEWLKAEATENLNLIAKETLGTPIPRSH